MNTPSKTPSIILEELDAHERSHRNKRLLFTAVPLVLLLGAYVALALAVRERSAELDTKTDKLAQAEQLAAYAEQRKSLAEIGLQKAEEERSSLEAEKLAAEESLKVTRETLLAASKGPDDASSLAEMRKILQAPPQPTARQSALDLWKQGQAAFNAGNRAQAKTFYERARATDSTLAAPPNSLGRLAYEDGDLATADRLFQDALRISPNYVAAIYNRALVAKKQGRRDEAIALTNQSLKIRPDYAPSVSLKRDLEASSSKE